MSFQATCQIPDSIVGSELTEDHVNRPIPTCEGIVALKKRYLTIRYTIIQEIVFFI